MYQVNININAGSDFSQTFYLTNPDKTPQDLTGCKIYGQLAKHSKAIIAHESTSDNPVYAAIPFEGSVTNGTGGEYTLSLPNSVTNTLNEGKYVYSVIVQDVNGTKNKVMNGLAFVDFSFGNTI